MKNELSILLLIIAIIIFAGTAASETTDEASDVYKLGEVIVTGERPGVEAVATQWEITAFEIENKNVKTLDEALELLPGVNISSRTQGVPRVDLRGMRSRHVILLLNGIPINSTSDGQFNPAIIATENIAKIKVSYSGSSVLYGQGALGGVINIITKKGKKGFNGSISGEIDEEGDDTSRVNLSGGTERFNAFISGSIKNSDGYRMSDDFSATALEDGGIRDNSYSERENFFANAGYTINDLWKIGLTLEEFGGEYGSPPAAIDKSIDPVFGKNAKYEQVKDYNGSTAQFSVAYDPENPFEMRVWGFYNEYEEERAQYDNATYSSFNGKNNYYTNDETKITGWNFQGSYDFGSHGRLTGSFAYEQDEFYSAGSISSKKNKPLDTPYNYYYEVDIQSLALEYDVLLFSKLNLALGYSHHWQKRDIGNDDNEGSFLFGVDYIVSDETSIRASISRKIRFPSLEQLYSIDSGNLALTTEESMNYELGVTQQFPWDIVADLAVFLNDVDDFIEKDDVTDINQNNDEYRFKGVELNLQKPFLKTGLIKLGYTYLDSENRSAGALTDVLQNRPENKFTLECSYAWSSGLSAYASIMHVADQYNVAGALAQELEDFTLVDIKLQQKILNDRVLAYIGAANLFDENYEESYGFPKAGRKAYIGMRINF